MKNKLTWVDSLKGIAICGVIMIHSGGDKLPSFFGKIGILGKNGVQLFFILSSLLIYISLEKFFKEHKFSFSSLIKWWKLKFIRLIPLYFVAIIVYTYLGGSSYWLGSEEKITIWNELSHIFFLHGFFPHYANSIIGVKWYIGVLAIFYIIAPFIYKVINSFEKAIILFIIMAFVCPTITTFALNNVHNVTDFYIYDGYFTVFWLFTQLPVLILGIVLFFIVKSDCCYKLKNKKIFSLVLLITSLILLINQVDNKNIIGGLNNITLFGIWFVFLIISLVIYDNKIIDNAIFKFIGKYSYPLYLYHYIVIMLYDKISISVSSSYSIAWFIKYVFVIVATLGISILLVRFIEKPLVNLLKKLFTGNRSSRI